MRDGLEAGLAPGEWLTTGQAARVVGLGTERIRQLAKAGDLPALETPHGRLFRRVDVEALRARRQAS